MLNLDKPMQTRDGRDVRYLGRLEGDLTFPLVFAVGSGRGYETNANRDENGLYIQGSATPHDIVNVPERTSMFHTFHAEGCPSHGTRSKIGDCEFTSLEYAEMLIEGDWEGVLEIIREDGVTVDVKFHKGS